MPLIAGLKNSFFEYQAISIEVFLQLGCNCHMHATVWEYYTVHAYTISSKETSYNQLIIRQAVL